MRTTRVPRICHLITRLVIGGAQRLALESVAHARARGWNTELWCGPEEGPEGSLRDEARARGIPLTTVPDLVRAVSPWRDWRALKFLERRFRTGRFDLVHTHSSKAGLLGRLAAERANVPVRIHTVHGWSMTPRTPATTTWLYTLLERGAAHRAHRLIAVSAAVRDAGLALGIGRPELYAVVHGAIRIEPLPDRAARETARRELGIPANARVAGTIARLDDAKNPLGVFEAMASLLHERVERRLVFIGDGHLRAALEAAIRREGLADRVILAGRRADAARLAAAFDVFLLASLWEGFPLAVIEAMSAGLPVVSFDVAGVREAIVAGRTGYLTSPGNYAELGRRIAELLNDPDRCAAMGSAGRRVAEERFGLDSMFARLDAIYEQTLGDRFWAVE